MDPPLTAADRRREVLGEWGQWLNGWDWDWWVTLTFDPKRAPSGRGGHTAVGWSLSDRLFQEWLDATVSSIPGRAGGLTEPDRAYWVRAREPNPYRYGTHYHALLGGMGPARRDVAWRRWFERNGMARIEPFDATRGAGFYLTKYVVKQLGDVQFSDNLGLHRRVNCDLTNSGNGSTGVLPHG